MKSEDDEKKPMMRETCSSRAHFSLLKSLCYLSLLQPPLLPYLELGANFFSFQSLPDSVFTQSPQLEQMRRRAWEPTPHSGLHLTGKFQR